MKLFLSVWLVVSGMLFILFAGPILTVLFLVKKITGLKVCRR